MIETSVMKELMEKSQNVDAILVSRGHYGHISQNTLHLLPLTDIIISRIKFQSRFICRLKNLELNHRFRCLFLYPYRILLRKGTQKIEFVQTFEGSSKRLKKQYQCH